MIQYTGFGSNGEDHRRRKGGGHHESYQKKTEEFLRTCEETLLSLVALCKKNGVQEPILDEAELRRCLGKLVEQGRIPQRHLQLMRDIQGLREMAQNSLEKDKDCQWEIDEFAQAMEAFRSTEA